MKDSKLLSWIDSTYWAMYPPAFESLRAVVSAWAGPAPLSREDKDTAIASAQAARQAAVYQAPATIAVLSMFGVISPRAGMVSDLSQEGCSLDRWAAQYRSAMLDSNVAGVLVNADTPGGNVYQVQETADLIYSLREMKPNVCVVTGMGASAGLYLISQFRELVCSPSAEVGSIGVLMRHQEVSKMAEAEGVTTTYITSPRDGNKAEGNPFTPLAAESVEYYNSRTDEYYDMFLDALVRGRGVSRDGKTRIDREWGRGRMVGAAKALSLGMVDRVATIQDEIDRMAKGLKKTGVGARTAENARLKLA